MAILIVIVGISLLIFVHELGHFLVAKKMGLLVEEFGFGFPPRLFSWKRGETTYSLNWLPFGGFVRIAGEEPTSDSGIYKHLNIEISKERMFFYQPAWKRSLIIVAGVVMNFILGWFLMSLIFMIGTPKALFISQVLPDSPAAAVGLQPQDQIQDFSSAKEFSSFVSQNRGKEITVRVNRAGEDLSFKAVSRLNEEAALGVGLVESGLERQPFFTAIWEGLKASGEIIAGI